MTVHKVISGHQTGADRGAIDAAIALGIEVGGYVPAGYRAEDGQIPRRYWGCVGKTLAWNYAVRTELNVRNSDGTLVVSLGELHEDSGSRLTLRLATKHGKPSHWRLLDAGNDRLLRQDAFHVRQWIDRHQIQILNVAGPRESREPGIYQSTKDFLTMVLSPSGV